MKNTLIFSLLIFGIWACSKTETPIPDSTQNVQVAAPQVATFDTKNKTLLLKGSFEAAAHATSGTVKLYEDSDKKRTLVFENFKTDNGPDIRIWVAEDIKAKNYIEISDKVLLGDYFITLTGNIDFTKQTHILIWCKQFTVLFGNAKLQ